MAPIAIVTDTNSSLTQEEAAALGIHLVPMPFTLGGRARLEGVDCTQEEFFTQLTAGAEVSTSQPAPGTLTELWERLLADHEEVLFLPMSSALSATCATAQMLARDYGGRVVVVDDHRISVTLRQSVEDACALARAGLGAAAIRDRLEAVQDRASIYIAVDSLELLRRSGRITAAAATMASVLSIRPVLKIEGGKLDAFKKVRGQAHREAALLDAMDRDLREKFAGRPVALYAAWSGDEALGRQWHETVQARFPDRSVRLARLPLSICCHIGAGALAVACAEILAP